MEQHRDAPSHATMFSCDVCDRTFESRHAVAQHEASRSHATSKAVHAVAELPSLCSEDGSIDGGVILESDFDDHEERHLESR
jgi:hypothetical protein